MNTSDRERKKCYLTKCISNRATREFYLWINKVVNTYDVAWVKWFRKCRTLCAFTGHIIATCLPPISTAGMTKEDMPHLMEEVRAQMMEVYTKTSSQVRAIEVEEKSLWKSLMDCIWSLRRILVEFPLCRIVLMFLIPMCLFWCSCNHHWLDVSLPSGAPPMALDRGS